MGALVPDCSQNLKQPPPDTPDVRFLDLLRRVPDSLLHLGPAAPALTDLTARQRVCTAPGKLHVSITRDSLNQRAAPATTEAPADTTPPGTDRLEDTARLPTSTAAAVLTPGVASPSQVSPPLHALELHGDMMSADVTGGGVVMELSTAVSYLGERCCLGQLRLHAIDVASEKPAHAAAHSSPVRAQLRAASNVTRQAGESWRPDQPVSDPSPSSALPRCTATSPPPPPPPTTTAAHAL
ncbi:MAG: hypothetical protein WDW38_008282 [Sanguina aurantia]